MSHILTDNRMRSASRKSRVIEFDVVSLQQLRNSPRPLASGFRHRTRCTPRVRRLSQLKSMSATRSRSLTRTFFTGTCNSAPTGSSVCMRTEPARERYSLAPFRDQSFEYFDCRSSFPPRSSLPINPVPYLSKPLNNNMNTFKTHVSVS